MQISDKNSKKTLIFCACITFYFDVGWPLILCVCTANEYKLKFKYMSKKLDREVYLNYGYIGHWYE